MEYKRFGDDIVVRLEIGEDVIVSLTKLCELERIGAASVTAIGATDRVKIGLYDVSTREYHSRILTGPMEITSLVGNISRKDGAPYIHLHINVGDEESKVFGGHLNECRISATCEIFVHLLSWTVSRKADPATGLNILNLNNQ